MAEGYVWWKVRVFLRKEKRKIGGKKERERKENGGFVLKSRLYNVLGFHDKFLVLALKF